MRVQIPSPTLERLVLDGLEGRADNAIHIVQLYEGVLRRKFEIFRIFCYNIYRK